MTPSIAILRLLSIICFASIHLSIVQAADIEVGASCSLADAVTAANTDAAVGGCPAGSGADTISLTGDISLDDELPDIETELSVNGNGFRIDGAGKYRIFYVNKGALTLKDVTLQSGQADFGAALVNDGGQVRISDSVIQGNSAVMAAGAIYNSETAKLWIEDTDLIGNSVSEPEGGGGAIFNSDGEIHIERSRFNGNTAKVAAAIYSDGALNISESQFAANSAGNSGGVMLIRGGEVWIITSNFSDNKSDWGGVFFVASGSLYSLENSFERNSAGFGGVVYMEKDAEFDCGSCRFIDNEGSVGGAIYSQGGSVSVNHSSFSRHTTYDSGVIYSAGGEVRVANSAFRENTGGAIRFRDGSLYVIKSAFSDNSAAVGGAISSDGKLTILQSDFVGNSADMGGAISHGSGEVYIDASVFQHNSAEDTGGALSFLGGSLNMYNTVINDSRAQHGAGVFAGKTQLYITNANLSGNLSEAGYGGGFFINKGTLVLRHVTMANNGAKTGGGIFTEDAQVDVINSIIAGSVSGGDCVGALRTSRNNLIEDGSCDAALTGDPQLGDMRPASEDGPLVYFPLLPNSPAIDQAECDEEIPIDLVGTPRPQGDACDIGAIEFAP